MTTCRPDDYPPYEPEPRKRYHLRALPAAILLALALALPVFAHSIKDVDVDCQEGTITAHGQFFGGELPKTITLTGPAGYSESYVVTTDSWSHAFPLGSNGSYSLDWPGSGDNGPVEFSVECSQPTPVVTPTPEPTPTPTPEPTPSPTPTPEVTPTPSHPTPSVVGSLPPPTPAVTPPHTSTADTADVVADGTSGAIVFVAAVGLLLILHGLLTAGSKALGIKLPEDK